MIPPMVDGYDEAGLQALIRSAKRLLEEGKLESILDDAKRYREGLASTLLSLENYKHSDILETYLNMADNAIKLLLKSYSTANKVNREEAEATLAGIIGLAVSADKCTLIELATDIKLRGKNRSLGSITCVSSEKAVHMVLADIASLLPSGLSEALRGSE